MQRITNIKANPVDFNHVKALRQNTQLSELLQEIDDLEIGRKIPLITTYLEQTQMCHQCLSLTSCLLKTNGLTPVLVKEQYDNKYFLQLQYQACHFRHQFKEEVNSAYLVYTHLPLRFFTHSLRQLEIRENQKKAIVEIVSILKKFPNLDQGIFLYGDSGSGKSYLLAALTNELLARNVQCAYISMPEFVREVKNAISQGGLEGKVELLKRVPVLIIDDLGSEPISAFSRDEVLFPILDYRLIDKKPVFFASHMSQKSLEQHFSITQKGDYETAKGKRIVARISQLSSEILINN